MNDKLKNIKLLLLDVDGVLTDGRITFADTGAEIKAFNSKDGVAMKNMPRYGVQIGIVTARVSVAVKRRCDELGIGLIFQGVAKKADVLESVMAQTMLQPNQIAYMGDDLIDIGLMKRVAIGIAPQDAHEVVKEYAGFITKTAGGAGCVREACDAILKAQGLYAKYVSDLIGE